MVGFPGTDPRAASELIQHYHVGGIILFSRNIKNAHHARSVFATLQELRQEVSDSPLFIAIDQEGGCVARITDGVTVFPGAMALGAIGSERIAQKVGEITATELSALGINVNFAPVLDICTNPQNPGVGARSFGSDPEMAASLGAAMIRGMQQKGICATAKHFPGLGEATVDSHDELPMVNAMRSYMEKRELVPFESAINANVAFVMTAHCCYPSLDDTRTPSTLSKPILTDLLRKRMGFKGIIITDCLEMAAIEKNWSTPQATVKALQAGADMALICHTKDKQVKAIASVMEAVEKGQITADVLDDSANRIASLKNRLRLHDSSAPSTIRPEKSFSEAIADDAVSILRNEDHVIPLRLTASEKLAVIVPAFDVLTKVEESAEPHRVLIGELERRHPNLLYRKITVEPGADEIRDCIELGKTADKVLILTYNAHRYPSQMNLVNRLVDVGKQTVVVAVRDPYDLALIAGAKALIATYGFRECSLKALSRVLFGELEAKGRLPIKLD
jgi:beta-N-acetylhexosaminidase